MTQQSIDDMDTALAKLMRDRMGIRRGETLADKVRIAGRLLPRQVRREAKLLIENGPLMRNPKLRRQVDLDRMDKAFRSVERHLLQIDPKEQLKGRVLSILAVIAFNFLLAVAVTITVMVWRGDL